MANPEHLKILKEGLEAWNEWRIAHPRIVPDLSNADLSSADLCEFYLTGADLSGAVLTGGDLSGADLTGTRLKGANLSGVEFSATHLAEADLNGADLTGATMCLVARRTDFRGARFGYTIFADADLKDSTGLESAIHFGPSTIGLDTIYRSKGKIPESFLRGAGVPDNFITFMKSLTTSAFEFYSAFISYSSKDQNAADRIHSDLQAKGVRCWLATEDLKIGDPFRQRIDESIKLHDKLLLILSEHSVESPWVADEVEAALERERRDKRLVLFPIRIDDAVMDTAAAWAASIRRTRHIGDFTRWKEHDQYQKAFDRLLRDLKAEAKVESFYIEEW